MNHGAYSAQKAYRNTSIQTASQGRLVAMLFEGAIKFMNQFREAVNDKRIAEAHESSIKAQKIMTELMVSLDHEKAPDVSRLLSAAYEDIRGRMISANVRKDIETVDKIIEDLDSFKQTWSDVFKKADSERISAPGTSGVSLQT